MNWDEKICYIGMGICIGAFLLCSIVMFFEHGIPGMFTYRSPTAEELCSSLGYEKLNANQYQDQYICKYFDVSENQIKEGYCIGFSDIVKSLRS